MTMNHGKKIILFSLFLILFLGAFVSASAQTCTDAGDCQRLIDQYTDQINKLQGQANTLKNQIAQFDAQIKLTTLKIKQTQDQIDLLGGRIDQLEVSLTNLTQAFSSRAVETYKLSKFENNFSFVLTSNDVSDAVNRFHYLQKIQEEDRSLLTRLQEAQTTYKGEKVDQETLQKQLKTQQANLNSQKTAKNSLLSQTQNNESKYQTLLTQARAQLASFASFADSRGASLLSNQTFCDSWGCYYNQRDSQWGALLINGRSDCNGPCSLARVGCLVTSVAMVVSHYGHKDILPSDIATSSSANYQVNTALLREGTINVKGMNITRTTISSSLNPDLLKDGPVIVGLYYGSFGTHFVVIKEYKDGKYIMNDPFTEGGRDKIFTDYYSLGKIFKVNKVTI